MADATFSINEYTGARCVCSNCGNAAPAEGFDDCMPCAVAVLLIEQPDYLAFAKRTFIAPKFAAWLAELEREWNRQASALVACGQMVAA